MINLRPMAEVGQCLLARRIRPHKRGLKRFGRFYPSTNPTVILRQTTFVEVFWNQSKILFAILCYLLASLTHSLIYNRTHVCFENFEIRTHGLGFRTHPLSLQVRYWNNNGSWFQKANWWINCKIDSSYSLTIWDRLNSWLRQLTWDYPVHRLACTYFWRKLATFWSSTLATLFRLSLTLDCGVCFRPPSPPAIGLLSHPGSISSAPDKHVQRAGEDIKRRQEGATKGVSRDNADSAAPWPFARDHFDSGFS